MVCGQSGNHGTTELDALVAILGASFAALDAHKVDWARLPRAEYSLDVVKSKSGKEKTVTSVSQKEGKQIVVKLEGSDIVSIDVTVEGRKHSLSDIASDEHVVSPDDFPIEELRDWQNDLYMLIEGL